MVNNDNNNEYVDCEASEPEDVWVGRSESEVMTSGDDGQTAAARGSAQSSRSMSIKRRGCVMPRRCESDTSLNDVTQH